jgi:hypothetical protein
MPRRSTILKRERAAKPPKAAPRLPVRLEVPPVPLPEAERLAAFLLELSTSLTSDLVAQDADQNWIRATKLMRKRSARLGRLLQTTRLRHSIDTEARRRAVQDDLLDRQAAHVATLEAIASKGDTWRDRVHRALRLVKVLHGPINAAIPPRPVVSGDPSAARAIGTFREENEEC